MASSSLTLFTTTRPFEGVHAVHQMNALRAWSQLDPKPQVIVVGDDPGAQEAADALGVDFEPEVRRSEAGLPYLSDVFARAQSRARGAVSCYANADIVFPPDLPLAIDAVASTFERFLMVGQRWDLTLDEPLDLGKPNDWSHLRDLARRDGILRGPYWVDFFAFPTGLFEELPDLILGTPGWDNWLVWHARDRRIPVVDVTDYLIVIHHEHHRSHGPRGKPIAPSSDAAWNRALIRTESHMFTVGHATHRLTSAGRIVPARGTKYISARLLNRLHPVLRLTRRLRHRLGIDADAAQRLATRLNRR